ncbi:MAG: hypothetical protein ABEJ62_01150 [Candidatus Nanohaloarchaea archaeon]
MSRRGQMFSTDFVASAFVFLVILNIAFFTWNTAYEQQSRFMEEKAMRQEAFHLASLMVRTPGYPEDWNSTNVEIVGLAEPDHVIQDPKVQEMKDVGYSDLRAVMGLERTEFFLNVTTPSYSGTVGKPPTGAGDIVVEERAVIVNSSNLFERGRLRLLLWN